MNSQQIEKAIQHETQGWTPEQRAALLTTLQRETTRLEARKRYKYAGDLAQAVDSTIVQTPAMRLIDSELRWALNTPNARLVVSVPPQQGKSTRLAVHGVVYALVHNPDTRCAVASYSDTLARTHVRAARDIINSNGSAAKDPMTDAPLPDKLGIAISRGIGSASNWRLEGKRGGCYGVGVGGSLTGRAVDLLIIDDPLKGMAEADSPVERHKVINWWDSVAQTRLAPGAPVILIMTRWNEDDLAGHVIKQDEARADDDKQWRVVNIPAIAQAGVPDSLGREAGESLESTRGHTLDDWTRIREQVGPRVWSALYQGMPTPGEGGLFSRDWFDRYRLPAVGDDAAIRLVSVDPAETGKGDEAGIVAVTATADARVLLTDDRSGRMTSDRWAREAVILACETGATEIVFEAFTTGPTYEQVIRNAWRTVRNEARLLAHHGGDLAAAAVAYSKQVDAPDNPLFFLRQLESVRIPDQDDEPFHIKPWRAKGDKTARAAGTRQAASTGRLRLVGSFPDLEQQAVSWQQGQPSPDRMDALVNGYERAVQLVGGTALIAVPGQQPRSSSRSRASFSWGAVPSGF